MEFRIDKAIYQTHIRRTVIRQVLAPRLVVVSYQPNHVAKSILETCLDSIKYHTPEEHELWVVDNNSPYQYKQWLLDYPGVNVIFNETQPDNDHTLGFRQRLKKWRTGIAPGSGSYANAIALEIAARVIDSESHYMMPLHMDTMACRRNWLSFLMGKLQGNVAAAGVRMDKTRTPVGILHVLGYLVDFQLFRQLQLDFLPEFPQFDVGDRVTVMLRQHGYNVFACRNTIWDPDLIDYMPENSPFRKFSVDRALDDAGNVIFLHLGRGVRKSKNDPYTRGATSDEWLEFAKRYVLT